MTPKPARRLIPWLLAALLAAAAVAAPIVAWRALRFDNFAVVTEGRLYRSGQPKPGQLERLIAARGVRTVLCLRETNAPPGIIAAEEDVCRRTGARLVNLPMPGDGRGDFEMFDSALRILSDPGSLPALVHCARGSYRTGAVIALYRILLEGVPEEDAFAEMRRYRFRENPEKPLYPYLRRYLKSRSAEAQEP